MDDKGDDDDGIGKFFHMFSFPDKAGGFDNIFSDMSRQMEEMSRHMEDMFRSPFESFRVDGFHQHNGKYPISTTPLEDNPRDQMLKDSENLVDASVAEPSRERTIGKHGYVPLRFPSVFDFRPDFTAPRKGNIQEITTDLHPESETFTTSWTSSSENMSMFSNSGSGWSSRQVQTKQLPDGSTEMVEKTTENGQTCTTVTKTDPYGVSTTTTTCDRPAIEGAPGNKDSSDLLKKPAQLLVPSATDGVTSPNNEAAKTKWRFPKLFSFDFSKPNS